MEEHLGFDAISFLGELSLMKDNKKRCDFVAAQVGSLVEGYGLGTVVGLKMMKLNSVMSQKGLYNIEVVVPDLRRQAGEAGLEELVLSCHTDSIQMSLKNPVSPGVNDNGSGTAVLLHNLDDGLRQLSGRLDADGPAGLEYAPKTRYLFFTGEEGSLKGIGFSTLTLAFTYAFPGVVIGNSLIPGAGAWVPFAYSLLMMESMSRSPMFNSGLCGSYSWAMGLKAEEIAKPKALVNFDMVGRYAVSAEGGLRGLIGEIGKDFANRRKDKRGEKREAEEIVSPRLRTVVVPKSNISTNPLSWVFPVRHEQLSPFLSEIIYASSAENGRLYNVREYLSLGSSDHASVQQVSNKRKGGIETAMMIGLEGMEKNHLIHTKRDISVDEADLGFSCGVAERLARSYAGGWKKQSQVGHLDEISYAGLFGNGKDMIALARCYDKERDQWVNLYFRKTGAGLAEGDVHAEGKGREGQPDTAGLAGRVISLQPEEMIDWNLGSNLVKKGMLRGYEECREISPWGVRLEYLGRQYSLLETGLTSRRIKKVKADALGFLAERQVVPLIALMMPISGVITGAGVMLAYATHNLPAQICVMIGTVVASALGSYQVMKIPLRYSNVVAETMYDLESERANSQLSKAVQIND